MTIYAAAVTENPITGAPYIACGTFNHTTIDGRLNNYNAVMVAEDHFSKEFGDRLLGVIVYRADRIMQPITFIKNNFKDISIFD